MKDETKEGMEDRYRHYATEKQRQDAYAFLESTESTLEEKARHKALCNERAARGLVEGGWEDGD